MECIYCGYSRLYTLANGQKKCAACKRKFSLKKLEREARLRVLFDREFTARNASAETGMHFATVQRHYGHFRKLYAQESERSYQENAHNITSYDEYLYLPKSLTPETDIDKLQHFITLSYGESVYNLMMPSIKQYSLDTEDAREKKLLLKYLRFNRAAKLNEAHGVITKFWEYFEDFILKYKGVSNEQFIYYLKEAEWRFNKKQQSAPKQSLHH